MRLVPVPVEDGGVARAIDRGLNHLRSRRPRHDVHARGVVESVQVCLELVVDTQSALLLGAILERPNGVTLEILRREHRREVRCVRGHDEQDKERESNVEQMRSGVVASVGPGRGVRILWPT